jgi:hypothetical protein
MSSCARARARQYEGLSPRKGLLALNHGAFCFSIALYTPCLGNGKVARTGRDGGLQTVAFDHGV